MGSIRASEIAILSELARLKRPKKKPPWSRTMAGLDPAPKQTEESAGQNPGGMSREPKGPAGRSLISLVLLIVACLVVCDLVNESLELASCASSSRLSPAVERSPPEGRGLQEVLGGDEEGWRSSPAAKLSEGRVGAAKLSELAHKLATEESTMQPYFNLARMPRLVASSSYQSEVYLPCQIINLDDDQTVSWIRKRDSLVLSVDKTRLVDDSRFELNQAPDDWTLVLSRPNEQDGGLYECQVSSMEPKLSHLVELRMVRAESSISNFSSLFVRPSDLINLTCSIEAPQATSYVYWYKNKQVVHFDNLRLYRVPSEHSRGPAAVNAAATTTTTMLRTGARLERPGQVDANGQTIQWSRSSSTLIIREAQLNDTANYTCLPANAKPSQIRVVVVEDGLGSQPEKRSLQADSAYRLAINRPPLSQLLLAILITAHIMA